MAPTDTITWLMCWLTYYLFLIGGLSNLSLIILVIQLQIAHLPTRGSNKVERIAGIEMM